MQSSKDLCEKLLEDIDKTLDITRLAEEQEDIGMNMLENEHYFSPPVVNLDRFKFRKLTPDSPTGIKCIDADTPSHGKKCEVNVKNFYNEQILFYQKELENKQKVIDSLLLLLHGSSKIITRDEQKRPSQKSTTSIATQTNESVILIIQDDDNPLNFIDIDQVSKRETNKGNNSTKQDDSNQLNLTGIDQVSNNKSVEEQLEDYKVFSASKFNGSKEGKNQLKDIRQIHKENYVTHKLNVEKSLQNRLEKLANYNNKTNTTKTPEATTLIVGDSMIKHVQSTKLNAGASKKIIVKPFPGAKISTLKNHTSDVMKESTDHVVIHIGTNDLPTNVIPSDIASSIMNLATEWRKLNCKITISGIIARADFCAGKAMAVNKVLERMCLERNIQFISHDNINPSLHLNNSMLHLNKRGTQILTKNLIRGINKC